MSAERLQAIRVIWGECEADGVHFTSDPFTEDPLGGPKSRQRGVLWLSRDLSLRILGCPACGSLSTPTKHTITVHEDGTLSLYASVLTPCCGAHFFVERSRIRWC